MQTENGRISRLFNMVGDKSFWELIQTRTFGVYLALCTLVFIAVYVFGFTEYKTYLYSDMQGYWLRALERLNDDPFRITQYWAWPPGYHIFLAEVFRCLRWLGLDSWIRLETALTINIFAYSASVYALQRIVVRWFKQPQWMLVVLLLYGFGFPAWYFNTFLLAENLALPLFVTAVALLYCRDNWQSLIIAAALFAVATAIRPSIGPYGLAFIFYFFIRWRLSRQFIARAAVFSAVFFALVLGAMGEVSRISHGRVTGLSANGGLDFFIANSRYHRIDLNYEGWHNFIVVPAVSMKPENGFFYTNTPYYQQSYYYALGWGFIKRNPVKLIENFGHIRDLFFARMLPSKENAPGYTFFRPLWDLFKITMFLALGLYLWLWRGLERDERPLFGFMLSVIALTCLVSYLFTGEPRYTYAIIFIFYLLFFKIIEQLNGNWRHWKKIWLPFAALIGVGIGVTVATAAAIKTDYPPSMRIQTRSPADLPDGELSPAKDIGRLYFPYSDTGTLKHVDGVYKLRSPVQAVIRTNMEIIGPDPLPLKFDICSRWSFGVWIDGESLANEENPYYFFERNVFATLKPGRYAVEVVFDYVPDEGGFAINYNYFDSERWQHRNTLGVSDERVRFSLPETSGNE